MPSINTFRREHIPQALALWKSTDHIGLSSADEPAALVSFLERNPGFSFVVLDSDELVGAVLCGHDGRRGYIHHLAVAETHRRDNLGSRLLERCLASLQRAGITKCHAFVFHENPYAERFWQPQGWERRDDLLVYSKYASGGSDFWARKV